MSERRRFIKFWIDFSVFDALVLATVKTRSSAHNPSRNLIKSRSSRQRLLLGAADSTCKLSPKTFRCQRFARPHSRRVNSREEHAERSRIHPACFHVLPRRVLAGRRRPEKKPQFVTGIDEGTKVCASASGERMPDPISEPKHLCRLIRRRSSAQLSQMTYEPTTSGLEPARTAAMKVFPALRRSPTPAPALFRHPFRWSPRARPTD